MSEHGMIIKKDANGNTTKRIRVRNRSPRPTPPKPSEKKTA